MNEWKIDPSERVREPSHPGALQIVELPLPVVGGDYCYLSSTGDTTHLASP